MHDNEKTATLIEDNVNIGDILKQHGWELAHRDEWIAVQDHRGKFYDTFRTKRVGKIVGTKFYVTLTPLAEFAQRHTKQLGLEPQPLKSKDKQRDVTYWGFDTNGVSSESLQNFCNQLAEQIDKLI